MYTKLKTFQQRINNITGQLNAVSRMIEENKEYSDVVTQMKAARSALNSVLQIYTEEKLTECLNLDCKQGEICNKFLKEIVRNI